MKKKKPLSLALCAVMSLTLLLSACSGGNGTGTTSTGSGDTGPSNNASTTPKEEKPAEITIMLPLNTTETPTDTIKTELEKLTNTKLTYQFFPADTYEEKLNTAFATGSLPQATYLKNATTFLLMREAIKDGQFWEIGPYLSEFPNLSKLKPEVLDNTKVEGKLYSVYLGRPLARQGIIYRKDWADKLNIAPPETTDELLAMAKAFTEQDPDGNGQNDTTGIADRNELVYGAFKTVSSWFGTPNNWGEKDGQLLPEFMFPEYMNTMSFFKTLRDNGYINQDFAATSKTDAVNLFTSGKAGIYIGGSMPDITTLDKDLIKNVPTAVLDAHSMVKSPDGNIHQWMIAGYNNLVLFPKSAIKDEEELKKVLGFFDKMMTPEVANLMFWGIEGTHYTVVDGKAKPSEDKELTEREVKGYKDSVIGEAETNGMYESLNELPGRIHAEELIKENEKYGVKDPTAALDSATYASKGVELQQIITDATYKFMYGQIDQAGFEKEIEKWKKQGGQQMIEEFNASYKK